MFTPPADMGFSQDELLQIRQIHKGILNKRLLNAFTSRPKITNLNLSANMISTSTGEIYNVTLKSCTCKDFQFNQKGLGCKHIIYLTYFLGALQVNQKLQDTAVRELNDIISKKQEAEETIKKINERIKNSKSDISLLEEERKKLVKLNNEIEKAINEKPNAYPRIAGMMADLVTLHYEETEKYFHNKVPRAKKSEAEVKKLKEKTKEIAKKYSDLSYKYEYLKQLFPNIEDIFDSDFRVDEFDLEVRESSPKEIKNYLSRDLNAKRWNLLHK